MKLAIIGSRNRTVECLEQYIPCAVTEIVSGGAAGIDQCAKAYAIRHGLAYTEFLPEYTRYGRAAPILRNKQIVAYADEVLAFWDGHSAGTKQVIRYCQTCGKPLTVITLP